MWDAAEALWNYIPPLGRLSLDFFLIEKKKTKNTTLFWLSPVARFLLYIVKWGRGNTYVLVTCLSMYSVLCVSDLIFKQHHFHCITSLQIPVI